MNETAEKIRYKNNLKSTIDNFKKYSDIVVLSTSESEQEDARNWFNHFDESSDKIRILSLIISSSQHMNSLFHSLTLLLGCKFENEDEARNPFICICSRMDGIVEIPEPIYNKLVYTAAKLCLDNPLLFENVYKVPEGSLLPFFVYVFENMFSGNCMYFLKIEDEIYKLFYLVTKCLDETREITVKWIKLLQYAVRLSKHYDNFEFYIRKLDDILDKEEFVPPLISLFEEISTIWGSRYVKIENDNFLKLSIEYMLTFIEKSLNVQFISENVLNSTLYVWDLIFCVNKSFFSSNINFTVDIIDRILKCYNIYMELNNESRYQFVKSCSAFLGLLIIIDSEVLNQKIFLYYDFMLSTAEKDWSSHTSELSISFKYITKFYRETFSTHVREKIVKVLDKEGNVISAGLLFAIASSSMNCRKVHVDYALLCINNLLEMNHNIPESLLYFLYKCLKFININQYGNLIGFILSNYDTNNIYSLKAFCSLSIHHQDQFSMIPGIIDILANGIKEFKADSLFIICRVVIHNIEKIFLNNKVDGSINEFIEFMKDMIYQKFDSNLQESLLSLKYLVSKINDISLSMRNTLLELFDNLFRKYSYILVEDDLVVKEAYVSVLLLTTEKNLINHQTVVSIINNNTDETNIGYYSSILQLVSGSLFFNEDGRDVIKKFSRNECYEEPKHATLSLRFLAFILQSNSTLFFELFPLELVYSQLTAIDNGVVTAALNLISLIVDKLRGESKEQILTSCLYNVIKSCINSTNMSTHELCHRVIKKICNNHSERSDIAKRIILENSCESYRGLCVFENIVKDYFDHFNEKITSLEKLETLVNFLRKDEKEILEKNIVQL